MYFRPTMLAWFAALLLASGTGCQNSVPPSPSASPTVLSPDTIASVHWMGKRWLNLNGDAYYFSRLWSLPEAARVQAQTFDRLSTALSRSLPDDRVAARIPATVLRPLLDDLAWEESYLEVRSATNSQANPSITGTAMPSIIFAVRLNAQQASVWETNLAVAAELLTGQTADSNSRLPGWKLQRTNPPICISLSRDGGWTVISVGPRTSSLSEDVAARIRHSGVPFVSGGSNFWLEASLDLTRLAGSISVSTFETPLSSLDHLNLSVCGDGANVITRGKLSFTQPFAAPLEPWRLPTDLLDNPMTGFSAVRGLRTWLTSWQPWRDLEMGAAPDQIFIWSLAGSPYQVYLAAPLADARKQVAALSEHVLQKGNSWLTSNGYVTFEPAPDGNGVTWGNLPDVKPFIKSAGDGADGWLFAGFLPDAHTNPPSNALVNDLLKRTNVVYFEREETGQNLSPRLTLSQTVRLVARRAQMPLDSGSLSLLAVLIPRLGITTTEITRSDPAELNFYRRSTIGFTAAELHLLADWLESPQFPVGLYSNPRH
jgi:hypothetical protein